MKGTSLSQSQESIIDIVSGDCEDGTCWDSCFENLFTSADLINVCESELGYNVQHAEFFSNDQGNREIIWKFGVVVNSCVLFEFSYTLWGCWDLGNVNCWVLLVCFSLHEAEDVGFVNFVVKICFSESTSVAFKKLLSGTLNKVELNVPINGLSTIGTRNTEQGTPLFIRA